MTVKKHDVHRCVGMPAEDYIDYQQTSMLAKHDEPFFWYYWEWDPNGYMGEGAWVGRKIEVCPHCHQPVPFGLSIP